MFSLEHTRFAYWTDFAIYVALIASLAIGLPLLGPGPLRAEMAGLAVLGLVAWPFVEYVFHRFILHGLEPFKTWHASHHERPKALISSPTILSASVLAALVFAPVELAATAWAAAALTLGVATGYLSYAFCHHATHHWRSRSKWLKERKRWHAIHHRAGSGRCYGVTFQFWDHVFGTGPGLDSSQSRSSGK